MAQGTVARLENREKRRKPRDFGTWKKKQKSKMTDQDFEKKTRMCGRRGIREERVLISSREIKED